MDAFTKHRVGILKELSVERMHTFVLETLIQKMMARVELGIVEDTFDNSQGYYELLTPSPLELLQDI